MSHYAPSDHKIFGLLTHNSFASALFKVVVYYIVLHKQVLNCEVV